MFRLSKMTLLCVSREGFPDVSVVQDDMPGSDRQEEEEEEEEADQERASLFQWASLFLYHSRL